MRNMNKTQYLKKRNIISFPRNLLLRLHWRILFPMLAFLFCYCPTTDAQRSQDSLVTVLSSQILDLIKDNLDVREQKIVNTNFSATDELFNLSDSRLELADRNLIYKNRIDELKKDVGININGQYYFNYDPSLADDETQNEFGGTRARVGLEWKILREGLFGHRNKAKLLNDEKDLEALKFEMEKNDRRLYFRYNVLIYLFNEAKTKLLQSRQEQLQKQLDLLYQVYFLKGILYEDVVKVKSEIEQINVRIENNQQYNRWVESTLDIVNLKERYQVDNLPVLKINLDFLLEDSGRDILLDSIADLEKDIAFKREKKGINDISLRLQLYQNIGFDEDLKTVNRSFSSFGVGVSVPTEMIFNKKTRDNLAYANLRERIKFNNYEALNQESEIINYYYEYNYKMKQYMEFIHKEILYQEKIRMEVVNQKNYLDIYRSLRILRYMDVLRTIQLEVLDLKRQMYLLLLRIYGKTHYKTLQPFVRPLEVADFYERLPARRSLVLDQKVLEEFDEVFIKDYLMTNGIERVIINDEGNRNPVALNELKTLLKAGNIQVVRNLNENLLLNTDDEGMREIVKSFVKKDFDGVVLDLSDQNSPQKQNKTREFLIRKFDFFAENEERRETKSSTINVKLSKGYPLEFLLTLAKETDLITLQMDRKEDLRYLEEITKKGFSETEKLCLSIEPSSFQDRIEMEAFIDMVNSVYKIDNVVINGLSDFIALDTKAFIKQE